MVTSEGSLVLSGANPGAVIENVTLQHGDDLRELDDEVIIMTGLALEHASFSGVIVDDKKDQRMPDLNDIEDDLAHADGDDDRPLARLGGDHRDRQLRHARHPRQPGCTPEQHGEEVRELAGEPPPFGYLMDAGKLVGSGLTQSPGSLRRGQARR